MNLSHRPLRVGVFGASGTGKSTFARRVLTNTRAVARFCFDPEGELAQTLRVPAQTSSQGLVTSLRSGWSIFDCHALFPGRSREAFDFFTRWAFTASDWLKGRKLFFCDELQKWTGTGAGDLPHGLALVLETGRRYELDCVLVAQAANTIHNRIRSQLTEVVAFRTVDLRAREFLAGCGLDADLVANLPPGRWISRDLTTGEESSGEVFRARQVGSAPTFTGSKRARSRGPAKQN